MSDFLALVAPYVTRGIKVMREKLHDIETASDRKIFSTEKILTQLQAYLEQELLRAIEKSLTLELNVERIKIIYPVRHRRRDPTPLY